MKKILFITGTRADYGKLKSLMKALESSAGYEVYIYVSGMHLLEKYGSTYGEIVKDGYKNIYLALGQHESSSMSFNLGNIICNLTGYVTNVRPDLIVVHGDRIDALAGAAVGALNNIKVAHIEGGEVSGTIDESIRHAISKFSHIHLVANERAKKRVMQLGEKEDSVYVIGSPDIDIMLSQALPSIEQARKYYEIAYEEYCIFMYHPVTTEYSELNFKISEVLNALVESGRNYVVIYPNNDSGSDIIIHEIRRNLQGSSFRIVPSLRFEYFLTLLKNAQGIVGNSSAGIRESGVYGIPAVDIGSRQSGRYFLEENRNIQWVPEEKSAILEALGNMSEYRCQSMEYGEGNSTEKFVQILDSQCLWDMELQKKFIDWEM